MTDYQRVVEFNSVCGNVVATTPQLIIFDSNPQLIKNRLALITEEVRELTEAIEAKDFTETVDAFADILYVVHGMASAMGVDLDRAFDIVHKSNMSKLCNSEEEAQLTVKHYQDNVATLHYDSPSFRPVVLSNGETKFVVYNKSTGKILKNINYTPANFKSMLMRNE